MGARVLAYRPKSESEVAPLWQRAIVWLVASAVSIASWWLVIWGIVEVLK